MHVHTPTLAAAPVLGQLVMRAPTNEHQAYGHTPTPSPTLQVGLTVSEDVTDADEYTFKNVLSVVVDTAAGSSHVYEGAVFGKDSPRLITVRSCPLSLYGRVRLSAHIEVFAKLRTKRRVRYSIVFRV